MRRTRLRAVAIATTLSLAPVPGGRPAGALVQNVLKVLKEIETIRQLVAQLRAMYLNLQRVGEPSWRDLRGLVEELNQLARQGRSLAYSLEGIFGEFRGVLAGFTPMEPELYEAAYGDWTEITLDTLAATLDTARAQAEDYARPPSPSPNPGASSQRLPKAREVYWLPWSEWWMTPSGRR